MLVKFLGFTIQKDKKTTIELSELMAYIQENSPYGEEEDEATGQGRILYVDSTTYKEYFVGLVVTAKNQRTFCELQRKGSGYTFKVSDLDDASRITEFNFFAINKKNQTGLYQHYHQSCSLGQAMGKLKKAFLEFKENKREEMVDNAKSSEQQTAAKAAAKKYKGFFKWQQLVRKEDLRELLENFERIKAIEFDFAHLEPDSKKFTMLSPFLRMHRHKLSFINKVSFSALLDSVMKLVKSDDYDNGRIYAKDEEGVDRIIRLRDDPAGFGEHDYDDVARKLDNLEVEKFAECWVVKQLIKKCKENSEIFESAIK